MEVARANVYACHASCFRTPRAKHTHGSSLTFGKMKLAGASFLVLVAIAWLGVSQAMMDRRPSAIASESLSRVSEDKKFTRAETQDMISAFAKQIEHLNPNILYPAIPLSIGFFLIGRFTKK